MQARIGHHLAWAICLSTGLVQAFAAEPFAIRNAAKSAPSAEKEGPESAPESTGEGVVEPGEKLKLRQREGGKLLDRRGRFERRGDRYVFLAESATAHYIVLENLMLERVAVVLDESAGGQLNWNISGSITEFRGTNYILLQRAVVKSAAPNDTPKLDDPLAADPRRGTATR